MAMAERVRGLELNTTRAIGQIQPDHKAPEVEVGEPAAVGRRREESSDEGSPKAGVTISLETCGPAPEKSVMELLEAFPYDGQFADMRESLQALHNMLVGTEASP